MTVHRRQATRMGIGLLAACLTLNACGRSEGGAADTPKAVKSGAAKGTLTVWAMGGEGDNLPKLAKDFEAANPGVRVKVTSMPWNAAHDKLAGAVAAGTTPDISLVGTTWMPEFARSGALDPVPSLVDTSKFFPAAMEPVTVGGKVYGVPWYVDTRPLFYRSDLAQQAGITKAPETWDELKAAARTYVDKANTKYGIFLPPGKAGSGQVLLPLLWQQGGDVIGTDGKFTLDTPEMVAALKYYKSFFDEKLAPKSFQQGDVERWFTKGELGMVFTGPWMVGQFTSIGGAGFDRKFAVAKVPGETTRTSFAGGADLVVFKNAENRDAAWKFVRWLSEPDVQVKWYAIQKGLPSVQSAWKDPSLKGDAKMAAFGDQMSEAKAPPAIATWEQVNQMIEDEIEKVVIGGEKPEDAASTMQEKATAIGTGG
ncbi:sugar ABC transporter substrate-binding protein [Streptomyces sp. NPDC091292]|uniref:sugar ABC transporter substrate-binding protein n=1 Tax=Streptomyces sp. NPDC091292 TaxID=3365991 RepID=UPI00380684AD